MRFTWYSGLGIQVPAIMAGYFINGGEIPLRYFDSDAYGLTFKVSLPGLSFKDLFDGLCKIVNAGDISGICKMDNNIFNFTILYETSADMLIL